MRGWLDFMFHCCLLGCGDFFERSLGHYRLRKNNLLRQRLFVSWEMFDPKENQTEEGGSCTGQDQCKVCRVGKKGQKFEAESLNRRFGAVSLDISSIRVLQSLGITPCELSQRVREHNCPRLWSTLIRFCRLAEYLG